MRVLSFDTADDACTVLLLEDDAVRVVRHVATARDQARILAPLTKELLDAEQLAFAQLDRLAIATGPGSFTGLRVGLAFAQGLSFAIDKPLSGCDHFTATARATWRVLGQQAPLLVLRESKRAQLYACRFDPDAHPFLATPDELATQDWSRFYVCGNAAPALIARRPELAARHVAISETYAAEEAARNTDNQPALPYYLREADVTFPKAPQAAG